MQIKGAALSKNVTWFLRIEKVQVGKDQEKGQSEKDSHSKNRGGKKTKLTMSSYFPNRWPLSYLNLTKSIKTYIRLQQHKNLKHQDTKQKELPQPTLRKVTNKNRFDPLYVHVRFLKLALFPFA